MKDPGEQHMLENNCKRIFHVDQYFFLPKHATHSFTPLWSHSKFLWRERNPKSSKNVLCPCWLLFKVCPVTYFWEYFIIIYSLYFSVCFLKGNSTFGAARAPWAPVPGSPPDSAAGPSWAAGPLGLSPQSPWPHFHLQTEGLVLGSESSFSSKGLCFCTFLS